MLMVLLITKTNSQGGMKSKGAPGTDSNGEYLVRQLTDYANNLLNIGSSYIIINAEWPPEVVILLYGYR